MTEQPYEDDSYDDSLDDSATIVDALDADNDEVVDAVCLDTNANQVADTVVMDTDNDDVADTVLVDTDADGQLEAAFVDTDQDGTLDTSFWVEPDENATADEEAPPVQEDVTAAADDPMTGQEFEHEMDQKTVDDYAFETGMDAIYGQGPGPYSVV